MKHQGKFRLCKGYNHLTKRHEYCDVTVELDIDLVELGSMLGHKALRNKSRKTKIASGAVKARLVYVAETGE